MLDSQNDLSYTGAFIIIDVKFWYLDLCRLYSHRNEQSFLGYIFANYFLYLT